MSEMMELARRVAQALFDERVRVRKENDAALAADGLWPDHHKQPSDIQYARAAIAAVLAHQGKEVGALREENARLIQRAQALELMVADHPMVPARDPELNALLDRASRVRRNNNQLPRGVDWQCMEPIEKAIRTNLIEVEKLGAHRLLTDAVVLLERAQQRVAAWIDLEKPCAQIESTKP